MEFIAFRHTQHVPSDNDKLDQNLGLTLNGIEEARQIGKDIDGESIGKAFTFESKRAVSTTLIALHGTQSIDNVLHSRANSRIEITNTLDYNKVYPSRYQDALYASYAEDRQMSFTVYESDKYQSNENPVSTWSLMASVAIEEIMQSFNSHYDRVAACAREFIFPSLVTKILSDRKGSSAVDDYVQWYTYNIEAQDSSRVSTIKFTKKSGLNTACVEIESDYGIIGVDYEDFQKTAYTLLNEPKLTK